MLKLKYVSLSIFILASLIFAFPAQAQKVKLAIGQTTLKKVIVQIEKQTNYTFVYDNTIPLSKEVEVKNSNDDLSNILKRSFGNNNISYEIIGKQIILKKIAAQPVQSKKRRITGKVVDEKGLPIIGATVMVKGTKIGAAADVNGQFALDDIPSNAIITANCVGYVVQSKKAANGNLTFVLAEETKSLDEVVVIGYGVQRKRDLSGSIASVKGDVVNQFANTSVATALQGRISGVQVQQDNGQPGAGIQVRIRGANSIIGNNEPLWIINGFPGDINMINTADIETVEVMKDASATAIYGSRGSNGVVIVTTKQAKQGKVSVEYNGSISAQNLAKELKLLNAPEYMDYLNEKAAVSGKPSIYTQSDIDGAIHSTNWQRELFRTAWVSDNSINISGGTDKIQSSFGLSSLDQQGIVKNNGYRRVTMRGALNYEISKYFSAEGSLIYSRTNHDQMNSQGGSRGTSVIGSTLILPPTATPHYDDGTWNDFQTQPISPLNPLAYVNEIKNKWHSNRVMANAALVIKPIKGLNIRLSGNINSEETRKDYYKSLKYPGSKGAASINTSETVDFTSNNIVTYNTSFNKKHHITVMGGVTYEESTTKAFNSGTAESFISDVMESYDLDAATVKGLPTSGYSKWNLLSFLGRINYNFDDRYLLTASIRADGSSRYSKGNKWGYFPSAAFAWRLQQEPFLENAEWLNDLKLRVSYGVTGSTAISPYSTQNTLYTGNIVLGKNTIVAYIPNDTYTGGLKWETTAQTNIGVDFAAFHNRLRLTADFYYKKTTDLLNNVEMPRSSGYTTALRNIGSISNKGFEVQLDGRIIDSSLKWDAGLNFSLNRSKVLSLSDGKDIFGATLNNTILNDQLNLMREGKQMYLFYGYKENGYDDKGHIVYQDIDGQNGITTADKTIIGNPNPDFLLNFSTSISYKGFTLSAFLQSCVGNDIYSLSMAAEAYDYGYNGNTLHEVYTNHWTAENTNARYPNLDQTSYKMSDRFVYDGSYLKLKNLELSYEIPVAKLKFLKRANVYVSAQNLFTITSYPFWDPDVNAYGGGSSMIQGVDSYCYPSVRSYTLGARIVF
jgi:TonB-linked SusC/RagA family outer membrane protein